MKKVIYSAFGVFFFIATMTACNLEDSQTLETYEIIDSADEVIPQSLEDIIKDSDYIVKGSIGEIEEKVNMVRKAGDPTIPSENFYTEGHVYSLNISETYKGELSGKIKIILTYGDEIPVMSNVGDELGKVMVESLEYEEPEQDVEYIFFLRDNLIGDNMYSQANLLYQIKIGKDKTLKFVSKRIEGQFPEGIEIFDEPFKKGKIIVDQKINKNAVANIIKEFEIINNPLENISLNELKQKLTDLK